MDQPKEGDCCTKRAYSRPGNKFRCINGHIGPLEDFKIKTTILGELAKEDVLGDMNVSVVRSVIIDVDVMEELMGVQDLPASLALRNAGVWEKLRGVRVKGTFSVEPPTDTVGDVDGVVVAVAENYKMLPKIMSS